MVGFFRLLPLEPAPFSQRRGFALLFQDMQPDGFIARDAGTALDVGLVFRLQAFDVFGQLQLGENLIVFFQALENFCRIATKVHLAG